MYGIAESPGKLLGDIYLDTGFHVSTVFFYPEVVKQFDPKAADSVSGYPVRLDLREHVVEFKVSNAVKGIEPRAVRKIEYKLPHASRPTLLINTREFTTVPEQVFGFVEQLCSGSLEVYKFSVLNLKKPTYHAALSSGDKNAYYYKQPLYLYRNTQNALIPFKAKNKKALLELLSKKRAAVESQLEKTENYLKSEEDIIRILEFYNQSVIP